MNLIKFRKQDFNKDIIVWGDVLFEGPEWKIQWHQSEHVLFAFDRIRTNHFSLTNYNEIMRFSKMFVYYSFPKHVNYSISSWLTTEARFIALKTFLTEFIFPNQILTARSLVSITEEQLSDYLNIIQQKMKRQETGSVTRYRAFCIVLKEWVSMSADKLLPEDYCIDIKLSRVLTKEIRSKCETYSMSMYETWQPMEPNDVEVCYQDAHRYIYELAPCIVDCNDLIRNRARKNGPKDNNYSEVREDGMTKEVFQSLKDMKVPMIDKNTKFFNFEPVTTKVKSLGYACGEQDRTTINISEIRPEVIHLKRACIYIIGLFTGLRRREISELKAKSGYIRNGDWYLEIYRYKTSDDPSGKGSRDNIPVPKIVVDAVEVLLKLFKDNRKKLDSDYLITSDIITIKGFQKVQVATIGKDVVRYTEKVTGNRTHAHQLRKTIAWLLISRSENNIKLIHQLFGHRSYNMTLRYILRNELMVESVIDLLSHNYTESLNEVFQAVTNGKTVGSLSTKLKSRMDEKKYKGQILVTDIETFVKQMLTSGIPLFVSRIPIGAFCIKAEQTKTVPPCMNKTNATSPQVEFCDYINCEYVLHTEDSIKNIETQIAHLKKKQTYLDESADERVVAFYEHEIITNEAFLLQQRQASLDSQTKGQKNVSKTQ
jgi:hypothetical protein